MTEDNLQFRGLDIDFFTYLYVQILGNMSASLDPEEDLENLCSLALNLTCISYRKYCEAVSSGLIEELNRAYEIQDDVGHPS